MWYGWAEAQVGEGDTVDVSVKNGVIVVRPSRPTYSLEQLVAKITPRNRHNESDLSRAIMPLPARGSSRASGFVLTAAG